MLFFMVVVMIASMIISIRVDVPASANIGAIYLIFFSPFVTILQLLFISCQEYLSKDIII